jgi:transcriptional regulator with XRE-family HTH domain
MVHVTIINDEGKLTKQGLIEMGNRLKNLRKYLKMTITEFADHCDVPVSTLYGWCNGVRPNDENKEAFKRLINTYHINKEWLFYGKAHASLWDERNEPVFKK